jgi:hypothetical protein
MMLRRTCYMNKRKEKKAEIDKAILMVKQIIEKRLKSPLSNDPVPLTELPTNFIITLTDEDNSLIKNFVRDIDDFVEKNNKYLKYKDKEEKAKVS